MLLREFVKKRFPEGKILEMMVGGVPVSGPIETTTADGIILVGDAARQSDPITGGGIINAMRAGVLAGDIAAELVPKGEVDKTSLQVYEKRWRETIGKSIARNFAVKEFFVDLTDDDLNRLTHSLDGIDIAQLDLRGLLKVLVRQNPKLLLKLRHLIV
jgi:2,3-di-O-geranylgeranylglyceryl phosphate reductase (EC 1.3.99.-)